MRFIIGICYLIVCSCYNAPKLGQRILVNYEGHNKETDRSIFYYTEKEERKNAGYDERIKKKDEEFDLVKIYENNEKIILLKKLEDPMIGAKDKILLIENNKIFFPELDELYINILSGGLLSDWDFDF